MVVDTGEAEPASIGPRTPELGESIGSRVGVVLRICTLDKRFKEALT
jgi:hypothetical protein